MDWLLVNEMPTGEIVLWHTLMNIGNRLGQKSTFNAPTSTMIKLTHDLTPQLTRDCTPDLTIHKVQNTKEKRRRGRTREEQLILKNYEEKLNRLTPMMEEELLVWLTTFSEKIILQGIRETVKVGGRTFNYLETVLQKWKMQG